MTKYVLGFNFNYKMSLVHLIEKQKPAWQKGLLNGIGGKIEEGETPEAAMRREFLEEAGQDHDDWIAIGEMGGEGWTCMIFYRREMSSDKFWSVMTQEAEIVDAYTIERLNGGNGVEMKTISNVPWLLYACKDHALSKNTLYSCKLLMGQL